MEENLHLVVVVGQRWPRWLTWSGGGVGIGGGLEEELVLTVNLKGSHFSKYQIFLFL